MDRRVSSTGGVRSSQTLGPSGTPGPESKSTSTAAPATPGRTASQAMPQAAGVSALATGAPAAPALDIIEIVLTRRPPEVAGAVDDFFAKQYSTELLDCARATHALETAMDKPGAVLNRICDDALALDKAFITGDQCNIPAALGRTIVNAVTTLRASLGAGQVTPEQIQALRKSLEALARELRTLIRGQLSSQDPAAKAIKAMLQAGIPLQDRKAVPQGAASTSAASVSPMASFVGS